MLVQMWVLSRVLWHEHCCSFICVVYTVQEYSCLVPFACSTAVHSPRTQGIKGWCGVGGACSHVKAFGLSHSHIKGNSVLKTCWADMP